MVSLNLERLTKDYSAFLVRKRPPDFAPSRSLEISTSRLLPQNPNWEEPDEKLIQWINYVKKACPNAQWQTFQEYGFTYKDGKITTYNGDYITFINQIHGVHGKRNTGQLWDFVPEFRIWDQSKRLNWEEFIVLLENKLDNSTPQPQYIIIGGGVIQPSISDREYEHAFSISFSTQSEARNFLDAAKMDARSTLEAYFRSLFPNNFPKAKPVNKSVGKAEMIYPFDLSLGPIKSYIVDTTINK